MGGIPTIKQILFVLSLWMSIGAVQIKGNVLVLRLFETATNAFNAKCANINKQWGYEKIFESSVPLKK